MIPAAVTAPRPSPPTLASCASRPSSTTAAITSAATAISNPVIRPTRLYSDAAAANVRARSAITVADAIARTDAEATLLRITSR